MARMVADVICKIDTRSGAHKVAQSQSTEKAGVPPICLIEHTIPGVI